MKRLAKLMDSRKSGPQQGLVNEFGGKCVSARTTICFKQHAEAKSNSALFGTVTLDHQTHHTTFSKCLYSFWELASYGFNICMKGWVKQAKSCLIRLDWKLHKSWAVDRERHAQRSKSPKPIVFAFACFQMHLFACCFFGVTEASAIYFANNRWKS